MFDLSNGIRKLAMFLVLFAHSAYAYDLTVIDLSGLSRGVDADVAASSLEPAFSQSYNWGAQDANAQCRLSQTRDCYARVARAARKEYNAAISKIFSLAKQPESPFYGMYSGARLERVNQDTLVIINGPPLVDVLTAAQKREPNLSKKYPFLLDMLKDEGRFYSSVTGFRKQSLDPYACIFAAESDYINQSLSVAERRPECRRECRYVDVGKASGEHLACAEIGQREAFESASGTQKHLSNLKNTPLLKSEDRSFAREAQRCLVGFQSQKQVDADATCVADSKLASLGLSYSAEADIKYILSAAVPESYIQILRIKAIQELVRSHRELVGHTPQVPKACSGGFESIFEPGRQPVKALFENPNYIENTVAAAKKIQDLRDAEHLASLRDFKNAAAESAIQCKGGDLTDQRSCRLSNSRAAQRRVDARKVEVDRQVASLLGQYPYLAAREAHEDVLGATSHVRKLAAANDLDHAKQMIAAIQNKVSQDLITSIAAYCETNVSRGGVPWYKLVRSRPLVDSVVGTTDTVLGDRQIFKFLQECLAERARTPHGAEALSAMGSFLMVPACVSGALLTAPTVVGAAVISAACGGAGVAMSLSAKQQAKESLAAVEACRKAGPSVCDESELIESMERLSTTESDLVMALATSPLDLADLAGPVIAWARVARASGNAKKIAEFERAARDLERSGKLAAAATADDARSLVRNTFTKFRSEGLIKLNSQLERTLSEVLGARRLGNGVFAFSDEDALRLVRKLQDKLSVSEERLMRIVKQLQKREKMTVENAESFLDRLHREVPCGI